MASCLGIYVGEHLIKYAKVSQNNERLAVESYGIKQFNNLSDTISQIVEETVSDKDIISINLSEEQYNYFYMSNLISKNDLSKAIDTEFESLCYNKDVNINAIESRYILVNDLNDAEKIKVIHMSVNKMKVNEMTSYFKQTPLNFLAPISVCIFNLLPPSYNENAAIVNIEDETTITIYANQSIADIVKIETGASEILNPIATKENSYAKAYQICKNTVMSTNGEDGGDNPYLADIIPELYKIASAVQTTIQSEGTQINKVYLTGTASVINNIELYFEQIIGGRVKCELLKPFFIDPSKGESKDYMEVNSAISMALQALYGIKEINFIGGSDLSNKLKRLLSLEIGGGKKGKKTAKTTSMTGKSVDINFGKFGAIFANGLIDIVIILCAYIFASVGISYYMDGKIQEAEQRDKNTTEQIAAIMSDTKKLTTKADEYKIQAQKLKDAKERLDSKIESKNKIPTMLHKIMYYIPEKVQIIAIKTMEDGKMAIICESRQYEQLAIFKTLVKEYGILDPATVVSSSGIKDYDTGIIQVRIEGQLPSGLEGQTQATSTEGGGN